MIKQANSTRPAAPAGSADPIAELRGLVAALTLEVGHLTAEIAEQRAQLAEFGRRSNEDHFLPVLNRRGFEGEAERLCRLARRHAIPLAFVAVDIERFRDVNDWFGYRAGNLVLASVAQGLRDQVRTSDAVGRLGADQFGALLVHSSIDAAHEKATALTAQFAGAPVRYLDKQIAVAVAAGVVAVDPDQPVSELFDAGLRVARDAITRSRPPAP